VGVGSGVGGDDGADAGEERGVLADEVERWFGHGFVGGLEVYVRMYQYMDIQITVNMQIEGLAGFFGGVRQAISFGVNRARRGSLGKCPGCSNVRNQFVSGRIRPATEAVRIRLVLCQTLKFGLRIIGFHASA
jgi:hypothetical protein